MKKTSLCLAAAVLLATAASAPAQGPGRGAAAAPPSARASAPVDLTGTWVSIVTEDWIERMSPDSPPSGVGRGGRGQFDPTGGAGVDGPAAAAAAKGDPCRAYGAAGSLRVPGRLNITWADDNTLKIDMDAGKQTRLLHFGAISRHLRSARSRDTPSRRGTSAGEAGAAAAVDAAALRRLHPPGASLRVVTNNMTGGYLLSSRASYSENAVLTEHFTKHTSFGVDYFTVTAIVEDGPLTRISSSTFKKEPNGSKFAPTGCEIIR